MRHGRDQLADFPLLGLGFKGCVLTVEGDEKGLFGGSGSKKEIPGARFQED